MLFYIVGIIVSFFIFMSFFAKFFQYCVKEKKPFLILEVPSKNTMVESLVISIVLSAILSIIWPFVLLCMMAYRLFEDKFKRPLKSTSRMNTPLQIPVFFADDGTTEYVSIEPDVLDDMLSNEYLYASYIDRMVTEIKEEYPESSYDEMVSRIINYLVNYEV